MKRFFLLPLTLLALASPLLADDDGEKGTGPSGGLRAGHSSHGEVFNEGPRQSAVIMPGTGQVHFPITSTNAQAQAFFDQGVGQLHGFYYFEAERSFRQVAALDPNSPMAYWGMSRANINNDKRARDLIKLAMERKTNASSREVLWIKSHFDFYQDRPKDEKERRRNLIKALENILYLYPEDLEAKAMLVFQLWDNSNNGIAMASHQAVDALAREVLAISPHHPVHHYRIHYWDGEKPARALDSAALCGQSSPGIAHMWHMPGHVFTKLQRFSDAAWQQEAAARVDHARMITDRIMPNQIHNYAHNNDWLVENLLYVGRVQEAMDLAKNMIELPRPARFHSETNSEGCRSYNGRGTSFQLGRTRLMQLLREAELWEEVVALNETVYLDPLGEEQDRIKRLRLLGTAYGQMGKTSKVRHQIAALEEIEKEIRHQRQEAVDTTETKARQDKKNAEQTSKLMVESLQRFSSRVHSIEAALAEVTFHLAICEKLTNLVELLAKVNDLSDEQLSRLHWRAGNRTKALDLAKGAYEKRTNQVLALANYTDLLWRNQQKEEATRYFNALRTTAAEADPKLPVFQRLAAVAKASNLSGDWRFNRVAATDVGVRPNLASLGPFRWHPYPAPSWELSDGEGKKVSLKNFQGKPVLVIFYLGYGCAHCIEQLNSFAPLLKDYKREGINLVAISTDSAEGLKKTFTRSKENFPFPLLSDQTLETFRSYRAYDDFEKMPLHGTFLIDGSGLVCWQDISYEPFKEPKFLLQECQRLLSLAQKRKVKGER